MTLVFEQRRLKYAASLNDDSLSESTEPDFEVKYVDIGNVDSQGNINELALYPFKKAPSRARRQVKHGDVIISTVRTYLQAIAPIKDPEPNLIVSTGFAVARPNPLILSDDYFKYAARESYFLWEVQARSKGVSYPAINSSELADILISLPPIEVQQQIAKYIDRETTEIDALVAEKEQMLALIEERRKIFINHIVTQGLDRNAILKSSGVEWLGTVPKHWRVCKIKRLSPVKRGASPRPIDDLKYFDDDGEFSWVRISDVTASQKYLTRTTEKLSELGSSVSVKLNPDTFFVSIAGSVGKPIITKIKCCIHDGFVYLPHLKMKPDFLYYIFEGGQLFQGLGKLGTQLNLNTETVGEISIPIPPDNEIELITNYLDRETSRIDILLATIKDSIALLKERRSALINAAVTGQIEPEDMRK